MESSGAMWWVGGRGRSDASALYTFSTTRISRTCSFKESIYPSARSIVGICRGDQTAQGTVVLRDL